MEQNTFNTGTPGLQQPVPNATGVLVLGILSIVFCWCYGVVGIILGIVALVLAGKGKAAYDANPGAYTESSLKNLNAGKICAIIGLALNVLWLIYIVVIIAAVGLDALTDPSRMRMR